MSNLYCCFIFLRINEVRAGAEIDLITLEYNVGLYKVVCNSSVVKYLLCFCHSLSSVVARLKEHDRMTEFKSV